MPGAVDLHDDLTASVHKIILSSSESDYLDPLISLLKTAENQSNSSSSSASLQPMLQALNQISTDRETEIERICNSNHQEFISSVNQLQKVREGTVELTSEIMALSQSIEASTEKLAAQKKALVDSRGVRSNIDETTQALKDCLEVLRLANQVHDLLSRKNHYAALRALDELQNVHLREVTRYKIAEMIERSVPATQRLIADAVMSDLNTWLFRIRETSQFLGEVAFYHTELRRRRQQERGENNEALGGHSLNSAVELVADEAEEYDVLHNDEVQVDFSPLFECLHIHDALGQMDKFRTEYSATRRRQKELLIPTAIKLISEDNETTELSGLLEGIAGFAIVEKATMMKAEGLRAQGDVDELWDSMCQSAVNLISASLHTVNSDEELLRIKAVVALFIQTMDSWGYSTSSMDSLQLTLFEKYSSILRKRFSEEFEEVVSTDDYMPMPISSAEAYTRVLDVTWYSPPEGQEDPETTQYPFILPFSQMYPMVCIDIRNFMNQIVLFSDDHFRHRNVMDTTLRRDLDELLVDKVCTSLVDRLASQYPGQIVQILVNLDWIEQGCRELEGMLMNWRSSSTAAGPISLRAVEEFGAAKKKAEKRIFELVNSKIDDLIETAEYDWLSTYVPETASPYMSELTRYLSNIMSSVLLGLPNPIKELIYFDALAHISQALLDLPLSNEIRKISPQAVTAYTLDVHHLVEFVNSLEESAVLLDGLDELRQTTDLMGLAVEGNGEEFFDSSKSGRRFGRVDKVKGAELLEKVTQGAEEVPRSPQVPEHVEKEKKGTFGMSDLRGRFGGMGFRGGERMSSGKE